MKWHLDGWDRTGGRAFASLRPQNVELLEREETWGPIVYIGPPSFRPEPISSTSVVLSAARAGAFSPRAPEEPENAEIGFPSADAAAEFVRRAFVNAGGTGGGGDENPTPGQAGPQDPPVGGDGSSVLWSDFVMPWTDAANRLDIGKLGDAALVKYEAANSLRDRRLHDWPAVESGALQLITALAEQFPGAEDVHRFNDWHNSARTLHRAIQELELWQFWKQGGRILDLGGEWQLEAVARKLFKEILPVEDNFKEFGPIDPVWFAMLLLSTYPNYPAGTNQVTVSYLLRLRLNSATGGQLGLVTGDAGLDERYEAMQLWPVPAYAGCPREIGNVGQLVMAFVSAPGAFEKVHPRVIDVVAFAAALFASKIEDRKSPGWRERAAQTWLAGSMPRWAFRKEAERAILAAAYARVLARA